MANNADDLLVFSDNEDPDDSTEPRASSSVDPVEMMTHGNPWKILIVDDDEAIHAMTKMVLSSYSFEDRPLQLFSCHSGNEAVEFLRKEDDVALVLLDVVMETDDAGLNCAKAIREDLKDYAIRIILRTGQPGQAPEQEIITNYDINDYKGKTDLTAQKLFTAVTTSLRSYKYINELRRITADLNELNDTLEVKVLQRTVLLEKSNLEIKEALFKLEESQHQLLTQQQQLVQAEKLASVGQLAAGVAHEINNPIGFVIGNLEILNEYKGSIIKVFQGYSELEVSILSTEDGIIEDSLEKIAAVKKEQDIDYILNDMDVLLTDSLHGAERIKNIVQDLKSFSRIDDNGHREVDLNEEVIETALRLVGNELNHKCTIHKSLKTLPPYSCRPRELNLVIMNLLINACEAIEIQGEITLTSEYLHSNITISVSDTGKGMNEEMMRKLFDPFFTTKDIGKGTGLGLSTAQGLVKKHGGNLSVSSELGLGTTLTITLPVKQSA